MRKKLILTAAVVAAFAACSATVSAIPIDGIIDFGGTFEALPNSTTLAPATTAGAWTLSRALDGIGSYSFVPLGGQPATMAAGWTFTDGFVFHLFGVTDGGTGNNWYFNATSSTTIFQSATFLNVSAQGTLTGPAGYDPTPGVFNFTAQGPIVFDPASGNYYASWSAAAGSQNRFQVPDGGSTLMLLGTALGAFGLLRKRTAV